MLGGVLFWSRYSSYLVTGGIGSLTNLQGEPAYGGFTRGGGNYGRKRFDFGFSRKKKSSLKNSGDIGDLCVLHYRLKATNYILVYISFYFIYLLTTSYVYSLLT